MNPLFVLDDSLFDAMTPADVKRTFDDLASIDAARLPAPLCDIAFNQLSLLRWAGNNHPWGQKYDTRLTFFGVEDAPPETFVLTLQGTSRVSKTVGAKRELIDLKNRKDALTHMYLLARAVLISALATKNVEKKTFVRDTPRSTRGGAVKHSRVTTIRVPRVVYEGSGEHTDRSVRPHFRRGHIREQPFGQGRREHKRIWIEPLFINGDPEYLDAPRVYKVAS